MATRRLYYDDSYVRNFEAQVRGCVPAEPMASDSGTRPAWEVLLDQTAFYPSSGGQPNDLGELGEANILDVRDDGEEVLHIVDRELAPGRVQGCVLWPRRFDHMQQHTGQHLLSAMFQERFGLPTVSFHLGGDLCTIDLRGPEPLADVLLGAQRAANQIIFEDRPITVRYGAADQLSQLGVRKEVEREGILRAIEIQGVDLQPCGGTHVKSTGQIGMLLVRRCGKVRQDFRVEFACGSRAERLASAEFALLRTLGDRLSCAPEESLSAIEKALAERDANFKALRGALQQLAEARAALLAAAAMGEGGLRVVAEVLRDVHPELLLPLATELAKKEHTVALLALEASGQLVFAQHPSAGRDLAALLKQVFATFVGKGGGTRDFVRAKLTEPSASAAAIALARKLLLG
ncbi:MAG TPA: alanyl-tRNA editing protein [Candidatus Acidoferrum sp.]|nr:alanyl-tRNA editing protein [Candidatus Acidoferrum sp.]